MSDFNKANPTPANLAEPVLTANAVTTLKSRYLARNEQGNFTETPKDLFWRVATVLASAEATDAEKDEYARKFYNLMAMGYMMPNSPTLMNAGKGTGMLSACFVLPLEDSIDQIFETVKNTAIIQKAGGGTGFSFDRLRPTGDYIKSSGGTTSGPISFWRALSEATNAIQQGSLRRGANMGMMTITHPDILKFITAKQDLTAFTNYNISIKITNAWMSAYTADKNAPHVVINPRNGKKYLIPKAVSIKEYDMSSITPVDMWDKTTPVWTMAEVYGIILDCAWKTGEPGLFFIDKVNDDNMSPNVGDIEASNPCVTGDTLILTDKGYLPIADTAGKDTVVWNGQEWSSVVPRVTGENQPLKEVTFSNGEVLRCTNYHRFPIMTNTNVHDVKEAIVEAKDLAPGMRLSPFLYPEIESGVDQDREYAYTLGVYAGDGHHNREKNRDCIFLYGAKVELLPFMTFRHTNICANDRTYVDLSRDLSWSKTFVPSVDWSIKSRLTWLSGLIDTDGSACTDGAVQVWSVEKDFLHDVQRMLVTCGAYSSVSLGKAACTKGVPDGNGGTKEYDCQDSWRINIPRWAVVKLGGLGLKTHRVKVADSFSNKHMTVKVVSVRDAGFAEKVYCFTEPKRSRGTFGTVVTLNCGEIPLLPYEACNLASINVHSFYKPDEGLQYNIDWLAFQNVIKTTVRMLDNVIEVNKYPIPQIDEVCRNNRKIGLGIMGFADLLFELGIPYNSEDGVAMGERIAKFLNDESHKASQELAAERGVFPYWKGSRWDTDKNTPMRNVATTTMAPTGTISIFTDSSGGIEPMFSLTFERHVLNGKKMLEVNKVFARIAKERGFYSESLMKTIIASGTLANVDGIPEDIKEIFVCTHDISPEWHIRMQAAFQKHVDNSISKTINLPHDATREDVEKSYRLAWELGCKGVTVYRDGCRSEQPMALKKEVVVEKPKDREHTLRRPRKTPDILASVRIRQNTPFGHMHVNITVDPVTGHESEVFAQLGKAGDTMTSDLEAITRLSSLYLRLGGSVVDIIDQLEGIGSNVSIPTKEGTVGSIADALARALKKFREARNNVGLKDLLLGSANPHISKNEDKAVAATPKLAGSYTISKQDKCPECGAKMQFKEKCQSCQSCGYSKCS